MADAPKPTYREANRRYNRLYWPAVFVYGLLCIGGAIVFKWIDHPAAWMLMALAVVNTAPVVAIFWALGRWVRETDEYTRKKQVEAMLMGAAVTFIFVSLWGFLELYNVAPHFYLLALWPIFLASYGGIYCARCLIDLRADGASRRPATGTGR
jgi:hypothetical protein